jgi:uncharacterized protein (DUF934 family)
MSEQASTMTGDTNLYNIRQGHVGLDDWQRFSADETGQPESGNWLIPLAYWLEHADALRARGIGLGLLVTPDDEAESLQGKLEGVSLVAVDFPSFTDGRGFSLGYLIRSRLKWTGELRAVGDVLIDTVHYLARCGFDSFTLKPGHDPEHALRQFRAFSVHYQKQYVNPAAGDPGAGLPAAGDPATGAPTTGVAA